MWWTNEERTNRAPSFPPHIHINKYSQKLMLTFSSRRARAHHIANRIKSAWSVSVCEVTVAAVLIASRLSALAVIGRNHVGVKLEKRA